MAEEIVHISNIQPKQQNTAASGIGNAEFQDFVKTYEKNHQVMMNLVASTSSNATSIYRNILDSVKGVQSKQVSYGNSIMDALSTNNALAQTISTAVTTGLSKISSSLDVIGDLVLEVATPKVDPNEELAKQIWNKMLIDNRTFISKWKFDELDDMMHPSKSKKPSFAPIAIPGSSISGSLSSTLDEMYLMFDMYSSEVLQNQGLTIKTLRDIYTLGDLWSDSSVDVATSMSKYVTDTYTLLDLWSDEQMVFNKKVLELLGSYDDKLKLIQEAKEAAKNQSTNVTQQNQQKFGIANKQTNIGVDQSIKMQYTGNIDVRSIKELLESNAIFNPAKIQLIKYAFKSVATSIAAGLNEIRQVLSPKGLGKNAAGENIFDDPVKTIEGASALIKTITDLASLGGNTIKRSSSKSVFGVELFNIHKETKLIGKGNTKKLSTFIQSIGASIAEAFRSIESVAPSQHTLMSVKNITDMFSAITGILNPKGVSKSITLFGKTLFEKESAKDVDKELKSFNKRFRQLTNSIADVFQRLSKIKIQKDKIEGISTIITSVTQAISRNTIKPSDALGFNLVVSSVSKFFQVIAEAKVDTAKAKDINAAISSVMKSLSEHKITVRQAIQLGAISSGISSFFNILSKVKVDLTQSENVALALNEVLEVLEKRKVSAKQGASMSVLSGGIWLLGKALASIGKLERQITSGKNALVSFFTDISDKLGSRRTRNTMKSIGVFATGLATLGVAIVAFAAISPIAVVAAGVLALFGKTVRLTVASRKTVSGIAMFTASLAMLGVSLWAFSEVSVEYLPGVVLGLATLAGAIWLFGAGGKFGGMSLTGKPPYKMLGIMAAGLATLGLAMWAWEELGLTGETTLKIAGALATLAGAGWAFSKVSQQAPKNMAIMAAGVAALAGAVWAWQKVNPTWELLKLILLAPFLGPIWIISSLFTLLSPT